MSNNSWSVKSITISGSGNLVIDAEPSYNNRKKWDGEMTFHIGESGLKSLQDQLADHKAKDRLVEIAKDEMMEFLTGFKKDYFKHRKTLAEKLGIDEADVPTPPCYGFFEPDREIEL